MVYELKTKKSEDDVRDFVASVVDEKKRKDSLEIIRLMEDIDELVLKQLIKRAYETVVK